jgi:hypothetical protein
MRLSLSSIHLQPIGTSWLVLDLAKEDQPFLKRLARSGVKLACSGRRPAPTDAARLPSVPFRISGAKKSGGASAEK